MDCVHEIHVLKHHFQVVTFEKLGVVVAQSTLERLPELTVWVVQLNASVACESSSLLARIPYFVVCHNSGCRIRFVQSTDRWRVRAQMHTV